MGLGCWLGRRAVHSKNSELTEENELAFKLLGNLREAIEREGYTAEGNVNGDASFTLTCRAADGAGDGAGTTIEKAARISIDELGEMLDRSSKTRTVHYLGSDEGFDYFNGLSATGAALWSV